MCRQPAFRGSEAHEFECERWRWRREHGLSSDVHCGERDPDPHAARRVSRFPAERDPTNALIQGGPGRTAVVDVVPATLSMVCSRNVVPMYEAPTTVLPGGTSSTRKVPGCSWLASCCLPTSWLF